MTYLTGLLEVEIRFLEVSHSPCNCNSQDSRALWESNVGWIDMSDFLHGLVD